MEKTAQKHSYNRWTNARPAMKKERIRVEGNVKSNSKSIWLYSDDDDDGGCTCFNHANK